MHEVPDDRGGRQLRGSDGVAEAQAGLAKLDPSQPDVADHEFPIDELAQANAPGDEIAAGQRKVVGKPMFTDEGLDLFGFDERDVLTRLVMAAKVSVAFDSCFGDDNDLLALGLHSCRRGSYENALDGHGMACAARFAARHGNAFAGGNGMLLHRASPVQSRGAPGSARYPASIPA